MFPSSVVSNAAKNGLREGFGGVFVVPRALVCSSVSKPPAGRRTNKTTQCIGAIQSDVHPPQQATRVKHPSRKTQKQEKKATIAVAASLAVDTVRTSEKNNPR